jgi:hypothetical protein
MKIEWMQEAGDFSLRTPTDCGLLGQHPDPDQSEPGRAEVGEKQEPGTLALLAGALALLAAGRLAAGRPQRWLGPSALRTQNPSIADS